MIRFCLSVKHLTITANLSLVYRYKGNKYYLVVKIVGMVMITKPNKRSYRDMWMLVIQA